MKARFLTAAATLFLGLAACIQPSAENDVGANPDASETENAGTPETPPAPPTLKEQGPYAALDVASDAALTLAFDGTRSESTTFDPPLATYVIDITLDSAEGNKVGAPADDVPAMPMASTAGAVYLTANGYLFSGDILGDVPLNTDVTATNRIVLVNAEDGAVLTLNGDVVWEGGRVRRLADFKFGTGYKQRTWTGDAARVAIIEIPLETSREDVLRNGVSGTTVFEVTN